MAELISASNFPEGGRTFAIYVFTRLELVVAQLAPYEQLSPTSPTGQHESCDKRWLRVLKTTFQKFPIITKFMTVQDKI